MRKTTLVLVIVVVLLLVGAGLYWFGLTQGRSQLEAERQNFSSQIQQMNARMVQAEYGGRLTQARFLLCRTSYDLDQRNFGLANSDLKAAGAALAAINPSLLGIDPAGFEVLRKDIAATDINVAVDLETQRSLILNYSARLEDLLPKAPQPQSAQQSAPAPPQAPPQNAPQPSATAPAAK
jgi:hypothetical protein